MARKKDSPALKEAKRIFGALADEYGSVLKESKSVLKAFLGREGAKIAEDTLNSELASTAGISYTKVGKVTVDKSVRKDETALKAISSQIDAWLDSEISSDPWSRYDVKVGEAIKSAAKAAPPAIAKGFINRRIDALRKFFGDDSAYIAEMRKDLIDAGVRLSAKGRILEGDTASLWKALKVTPKVKDEVAAAIRDMSVDEMTRDEVKAHVKDIMNNKSTSQKVARYYSLVKASADSYSQSLQQFYDTEPGDKTTEAYADYLDVLDSLMHPGRKLTTGDIKKNLDTIIKYLSKDI